MNGGSGRASVSGERADEARDQVRDDEARRICRPALHVAKLIKIGEPSQAAEIRHWHALARLLYLYPRPHALPIGAGRRFFRSRRPPLPFEQVAAGPPPHPAFGPT